MKSWAFAAIFVSVAAVAACDSSGTGGSGGSGGTTSTSSSVSSSVSASSSTAPVCDELAVCGDSMSGCLGCAVMGDCADEADLCAADQECVDFITCIDPCLDQACFDACSAMYPTGFTLYNDLVFCAVCEQCPVSCDGPGSGCP